MPVEAGPAVEAAMEGRADGHAGQSHQRQHRAHLRFASEAVMIGVGVEAGIVARPIVSPVREASTGTTRVVVSESHRPLLIRQLHRSALRQAVLAPLPRPLAFPQGQSRPLAG